MRTRNSLNIISRSMLGVFLFLLLCAPVLPADAVAAGIKVVPTAGLITTENGGNATFSMQLTSRPVNPVSIPLAISDPTEAQLPITLVKFSPGNWNIPQQITVTGLPDNETDGDVAFTIITKPVTSKDANYRGLNASDVSAVNLDDAKPSAQDDTAQTAEDTPVTIDVLANDSGLMDTPLVVSIDTGPAHGLAQVTSGKKVLYTPAPDFFGDDQFRYKVCDADGDCSAAGVWISVAQVDDAPVAADDQAVTSLNAFVTVDVLANDSDPDGDPLLLENFQTGTPMGGTITRIDNGTPGNLGDDRLRYTPAPGFAGTDQFIYTLSDGALTDQAAVSVTVNPGSPVAVDDSYQTVQGNTFQVSTQNGVLKNDLDPLGQGLSAMWVSGPGHGTLDLKADGAFIYTPEAAFHGVDAFQYKAFDGSSQSNTATVTLYVLSSTGIPLAVDDFFSTGQKQVLVIAAPGVLQNDIDPEDDTLQTELTDPPNHGQLFLNPNGSFTYTPNGTYVGTDKFSYTANDDAHQSEPATVSVDVTDQINPTTSWVSPVTNGGIFEVISGTVTLEVEAGDNVGVDKVRFFRWDAVNHKYVEIEVDTVPPFRIDLDVLGLNLTWNQVFARAYDRAGNASTQRYIWLYRTGLPVFLPLVTR